MSAYEVTIFIDPTQTEEAFLEEMREVRALAFLQAKRDEEERALAEVKLLCNPEQAVYQFAGRLLHITIDHQGAGRLFYHGKDTEELFRRFPLPKLFFSRDGVREYLRQWDKAIDEERR